MSSHRTQVLRRHETEYIYEEFPPEVYRELDRIDPPRGSRQMQPMDEINVSNHLNKVSVVLVERLILLTFITF